MWNVGNYIYYSQLILGIVLDFCICFKRAHCTIHPSFNNRLNHVVKTNLWFENVEINFVICNNYLKLCVYITKSASFP